MAIKSTYNFQPLKRGDTFDGQIFTFREKVDDVMQPLNLTDCQIKMQMKTSPMCKASFTFSIENGLINIEEPTQGKFTLESTIIDIIPANYLYDIQITFPNGIVKTWLEGVWEIKNDITR